MMSYRARGFEVECIDRMSCNVYVPGLQYAAGLLAMGIGNGVADCLDGAVGPYHRGVDKAMHRRPRPRLPWVDFAKGSARTTWLTRLARFTGSEGVLFVGRAQEKTKLSAPRNQSRHGDAYP